jgi:hypothetical protein
MQGVTFATTEVGGSCYLLAADGSDITTLSLNIQSVRNEYSLTNGVSCDATRAPPRVNKLLNYVHSMCEKFPIDDCLSVAAGVEDCRTVSLSFVTGACCELAVLL